MILAVKKLKYEPESSLSHSWRRCRSSALSWIEDELLMQSWNQVVLSVWPSISLLFETWAAINVWTATCNDCQMQSVFSTGECDPIVTSRGVPGECVKSVSNPRMCEVCVCVCVTSQQQQARRCCLTLICKGRQYGSLTCPAPLSVAHTSPSPPRWLRCSLNTSSRLPQALGGEADGTQVALTMRNLRGKTERERERELWWTRYREEKLKQKVTSHFLKNFLFMIFISYYCFNKVLTWTSLCIFDLTSAVIMKCIIMKFTPLSLPCGMKHLMSTALEADYGLFPPES